jgi:hypothetical protein
VSHDLVSIPACLKQSLAPELADANPLIDCARVKGGPEDMLTFNIFHYDYARVEAIEAEIKTLDCQAYLRAFFDVHAGSESSNEGKWARVYNAICRLFAHPPINQPMHRDHNMVLHPVVLMALGEGRCGHVARVVVDIALANGFESRLVQLAAHLVAEIKWDGVWHFLDADSKYDLAAIQQVFGCLPSVEDVSLQPEKLDLLLVRARHIANRDQRTDDGRFIEERVWYPGDMASSSLWFSKSILANNFGGNKANARGDIVEYYYKVHGSNPPIDDRFYGWLNYDRVTSPIPTTPVKYITKAPKVMVPDFMIQANNFVEFSIAVALPVALACDEESVFNCETSEDDIEYQLVLSRQTRGWNYDYLVFDAFHNVGQGDLEYEIVSKTRTEGFEIVRVKVNDPPSTIFIETQLGPVDKLD